VGKKRQAYLLRLRYLGRSESDFPYADTWHRDLAISATSTLEDLSQIILSVLGWDDCHLYYFTVGDRIRAWLGSDSLVVDERMFNGVFYSAAIPLGRLDLQQGSSFTYSYDFGDKQRFLIEITKTDRMEDGGQLPLLVSQRGAPPVQYPDLSKSGGLQEAWRETEEAFSQEGLSTCRSTSHVEPGTPIAYSGSGLDDRWRVRFIIGTDRDVLEEWRRSRDRGQWEKSVAILENWDSSLEQIAEKIERPVRIIRKWIQTFNWYGIEGLNRPRKKRVEVKRRKRIEERTKRLLEILHQPPATFGVNRTNWSMKSIVEVYEKEYGERIGKSTASHYIRQAGYRIKKASRVLTSRDPDYREKVEVLLHTLQSLGENEMFYFVDELGPMRVKRYGGRTYTPKGVTKTVPQTPASRGSVTMSGALSATTNQTTWIFSEAKDTQAMIDLIEILFNQQFDKSRIVVTWDAASWHSSNELLAWIDEFNVETRRDGEGPIIELVPLPSGSQFLDVIEAVFSGMKRAVIHHSDYQSEAEMKTAMSRHFVERNEHFRENPRRAGNKIWDVDFFTDFENIRSGNYRDW